MANQVLMYLKKLEQIAKGGKKIAVIGLARENRQFLQWLIDVVSFPVEQILLADRLEFENLSEETRELLEKYNVQKDQFYFKDGYLEVLHEHDLAMVFKSPGIWSLKPEFVEFRKTHGEDSIHSSLVFFFEKFREQIIGVTGTKGKSSTTSLVAHLVNDLPPSPPCGNYPPAPLSGGEHNSTVPKDSLDRFGSLPHNPKLMERAKEMRQKMTKAEEKLWDEVLRSKQIGFKFNRQKVIGNYILDFFCSELLLGIEVDGEVHDQKEREKYLSSIGIKFLRFTNEEVLQDVEGVRGKIEEYLQAQFPLTRGPQEPATGVDRRGLGGKGYGGIRFSAHYCGNSVNISPYIYWKDLNQPVDPNEFFAIEISSFQLQDLGYSRISPKYAIITNYFVDHLDQHENVEEYWGCKDKIFVFQKPDDFLTVGQTVWEKSPTIKKLSSNSLAIITPQPPCQGELPSDPLVRGSRGESEFAREEFIKKSVLDESLVQKVKQNFTSPLIGEHSWKNVTQAFLAVQAATGLGIWEDDEFYGTNNPPLRGVASQSDDGGCFDYEGVNLNPNKPYQNALNAYQSLPHRLQLIRYEKLENLTLNFYDDGYATEPDAVAAAVKALTQKENEYLWLQITGKDKGVDVEGLFGVILETQQKLQLFRVDYCGTVGKKILTTITNTLGLPAPTEIENFRETVEQSFTSLSDIKQKFLDWYQEQQEALHPGQAIDLTREMTLNITLSPGGSSFDEFNNQEERALWWTQEVKELR